MFRIKEEVEDKDIEYPSYYLQPFHAYEAGNLDWTAAFEAESATAAMAIRTWRDPSLTARQALEKLYSNIFRCIEVSFLRIKGPLVFRAVSNSRFPVLVMCAGFQE